MQFPGLADIASLWIMVWEYVLYGSWPLWIRWIRESSDADICLLPSVREKLVQEREFKEVPTKYGKRSFLVGEVEAADTIAWLTAEEVADAVAHPDVIDGLPFLSLDYTIQSKTFMNRPKDIVDIQLIEKYRENWWE